MSEVKEALAKKASDIKGRDAGKGVEAMGGEQQQEVYQAGNKKPAVRLLRADEIECRVSMIGEKGLSLLLFKDARVDQKILDETFTPFGWRRTHQCIDGNLYCTVEIWDQEKQQWVAKQDVGTTSYSEKEKGQASDSFKRACFNWGVGRELYTAPFIWIPSEKTDIRKDSDRYRTQDRFSVQSIAYNGEREIAVLTIVNKSGCTVFEWTKERIPERERSHESGKQKVNGITDMQMAELQKELERTRVSLETVLARYHLQNLEQMTEDIYLKALNSLKKSKTKKAA